MMANVYKQLYAYPIQIYDLGHTRSSFLAEQPKHIISSGESMAIPV